MSSATSDSVPEIKFLLSPSANLLLFALSRIYPAPPGFTTIPPSSDCLIFHYAPWQRNCGACAAFAISTLVAMHACLEDGEDFIPSPYRIFDCANGTCEAGVTFARAMSVVRFGVGDVRESSPVFGLSCELHRRRQKVPSITRITMNDPLEIKTALLFFGPLLGSMTNAVDRDPLTGAYRLLPNLSTDNVDRLHAVVVVGWDAADNWIVQNSWGEEWGDGLGRGRIAQEVLGDVFDPSTRILTRLCLALYLATSVALVAIAPPKRRLACAAICAAMCLATSVYVLVSARALGHPIV